MIEYFVSPSNHDHLIFADIRNVMRPTGRCLDNFRLVTIGNQFVYFACVHMAEFEPRPALYDEKLFGLAVVVMTTARDAWICGEIR